MRNRLIGASVVALMLIGLGMIPVPAHAYGHYGGNYGHNNYNHYPSIHGWVSGYGWHRAIHVTGYYWNHPVYVTVFGPTGFGHRIVYLNSYGGFDTIFTVFRGPYYIVAYGTTGTVTTVIWV